MPDIYSVFQDVVMKIHILQTKGNFYKKSFPSLAHVNQSDIKLHKSYFSCSSIFKKNNQQIVQPSFPAIE